MRLHSKAKKPARMIRNQNLFESLSETSCPFGWVNFLAICPTCREKKRCGYLPTLTQKKLLTS